MVFTCNFHCLESFENFRWLSHSIMSKEFTVSVLFLRKDFLFLFLKNFYFYFILLYTTVLVLPYIDMNPPWLYMRSQTWTPPPRPPSPHHPSGSFPCTSPKHAVSCIGHRLVIWFLHDSIHASVPFSQIIPPSPSPSESQSPLYTSVSFAVLHTGLSFELLRSV